MVDTVPERVLKDLLAEIRKDYYTGHDRAYYRDQKMLTYAMTWAAAWYEERGFRSVPAGQYHEEMRSLLSGIRQHGDKARAAAYFPRYLLKCVQDHFTHNGDSICDRHRAARNSIEGVMARISKIPVGARQPDLTIDVLAAAHRLAKPQRSRRRQTPCNPSAPTQQTLF